MNRNDLRRVYVRKLILLLIASALIVSASSVSFAKDAQIVKGWVSNSKCGAKDASADGASCTEKCLKAGASPVVVTDADQKVLTVDNPDSLKDHYGHHVAVSGKVDGDKIHIDSVKMIKE
jgi:pectin methylesterase-like acyl-CoA thioesterase